MAASLKRVAAFSNVLQHGEISIIRFTFSLILFLPCLFWCYPLLQCVYKSSTLFSYYCLWFLLCILVSPSSCQYIHICCLRQLRISLLNITVWRQVLKKFLRTKLFLVKFQTFSFQLLTFFQDFQYSVLFHHIKEIQYKRHCLNCSINRYGLSLQKIRKPDHQSSISHSNQRLISIYQLMNR